MNKTRFSAILLTAVMLVSMLSCMVLPAAAAGGVVFDGPLAIGEANNYIGVSPNALPTNVKMVNDDWEEKTGKVTLYFNGVPFSANMGSQAFSKVADAVAAAQAGDVIYVAPGDYPTSVTFMTGNVKLYGPNAGVCPNVDGGKNPNPARPGADLADQSGEAILGGSMGVAYSMYNITLDGFTMAGAWTLSNTGNQQYRNGLYFRNNVFASAVSNVFQITTNGRAWTGTVVIENNRILNGENLVQNGAAVNTIIRNNHIAITGQIAVVNSAFNGSIGDAILIDGNYIANAGGILQFTHDQASNYNNQVVLAGFTVSNNVVADAGAAPLVNFKFDGRWTLPGTNLNIVGNTIYGIDPGVTPFVIFYKTFFGNNTTFRHFININENYVDLPVDTALVSCDVNGVLNLSRNYYTNGITTDQLLVDKQVSDTEVVLYPYYKDASMTELVGSKTVNAVNGFAGAVDQDAHLITIDLRGLANDPDFVDLSSALTVNTGCQWTLYEEETLATVVDKTKVYLDGEATNRYVLVENTGDDNIGTLYRLLILRDPGNNAELLDLLFDAEVAAPSKAGKVWTYTIPSDQLFLNYDVKVSAGATYELFADSACKVALEDLAGYIPYGGYSVFVKVTGAKGASAVYTVKFNRDVSDLDPTIIAAEASDGDVFLRNDVDKMFGYLNGYYTEITYTLTATAGATYRILKGTAEVSSSAEVRPIKLDAGSNALTVEVKDAKGRTNTLSLVVENGQPSSDATIVNVPEYSVGIADGVISFLAGGNSATFSFETRDPNATCRVYADPAKKVEITGTGSFNVPIELATNVYYVVCTAQDGVTTKDYKVVITKNITVTPYDDLPDLNVWYADYVREAAALGLMQGSANKNGENVFRANDKITRQEMASVVCRLMGLNGSCFSKVEVPFVDASAVPAWAENYVKACYVTGYIKGAQVVNDLYFQPKKNITREEVMTIFARIFDLKGTADLSCFSDASALENWAVDGAEAMVAAGLIEGCGNGKLNPKAQISRAEMAALVVRAYHM